MDAFFFANHNSFPLDSVNTPGARVVGELELGPGKYVVFGRFNIGTNVTASEPPAYPHGSVVATLSFAGVRDKATAQVKPEMGDNIEMLSVMLAGESGTNDRVRLYAHAVWPLRIHVLRARIVALRVDNLAKVEVGEDQTLVPGVPRDDWMDTQIVRAGMHLGVDLSDLVPLKPPPHIKG
jgi:hypothetical protein